MKPKKVCLFCRSNNARQNYLTHKSATGLREFKGLVKKLENTLTLDVEYLMNQPCHPTNDEIQLFGEVRVLISQAETESFVPKSELVAVA